MESQHSVLNPVEIVFDTADGCTHSRKYVPGRSLRLSQEEYNSFCLGNLFAMLTSGYTDSLDLFLGQTYGKALHPDCQITKWSVDVISWSDVS